MTIKVFNPQISIVLKKNVHSLAGNDAFNRLALIRSMDGTLDKTKVQKAQSIEHDITKYIGDRGAVRTMKSINDPSGGFTITLPDAKCDEVKDSLYALFEPMDIIEIRMARNNRLPTSLTGGSTSKLPLVMRGFISSVRRVASMGDEGPERSIVVSGHDAGKLWLIHQYLFKLAALTQSQLESFRMAAILGIDSNIVPVGKFIELFTEVFMNKAIENMNGYVIGSFPKFVVKSSVIEGGVFFATDVSMEGPYWNAVSFYADRPWNEIFIEDTEEAPLLVFRPSPYRDVDGKMILEGAVMPEIIDMPADQIVSMDVARSDSRVANVFWVEPGASSLDSTILSAIANFQTGESTDFNYVNNMPEIFGQKEMRHGSTLVPVDGIDPVTHRSAKGQRLADDDRTQWYIHRMLQLKAMNRDDGVFEEGSLLVRGNEKLKIGRYIEITMGETNTGTNSLYYVTRVSHNFSPFRLWTTNLSLERGTGFLDRLRSQSNPYFDEGRRGPYTQ